MEKNSKLEIIVGFFVILMFSVLAWVILTLGRSKGYVGENFTLYTYFDTVKGLSVGNNLYLYGKYIGEVDAIEFPDRAKNNSFEGVKVTMSIRLPFKEFVKKDSTAKISSSGVLGGRRINIVPGISESIVSNGDTIKGYISADPIQAVETAGEVLLKAHAILDSINKIIDSYKNSKLLFDIARISHSLSNISSAIENKQGILGTLIFDKKLNNNIKNTVDNVNMLSNNLKITSNEINILIAKLKSNDSSILHQLIYSKNGEEIISNIAQASKKFNSISNQITNGNGLVHNILYEKSEIKNNIDESIKNIKEATLTLKEGRGTLGAIIMDPTIYEDLKGIFGKIKRNEILKSLIRFSIQREE